MLDQTVDLAFDLEGVFAFADLRHDRHFRETPRLEQRCETCVPDDGQGLGEDLVFQIFWKPGAARGDKGARRLFLVLGLHLGQMLQQSMHQAPARETVSVAKHQRAERRLLYLTRLAASLGTKSEP